MLKAAITFILGTYLVVLLVVTAGEMANAASWMIGAGVFVLVLVLGLWVALRGERRR